jgi:hypothetical protein
MIADLFCSYRQNNIQAERSEAMGSKPQFN